MPAGVAQRAYIGEPFGKLLKLRPGGIGTAVIHHDYFVRYVVNPQLQGQMFDRGTDTAFFIQSRNYDTEELQSAAWFFDAIVSCN